MSVSTFYVGTLFATIKVKGEFHMYSIIVATHGDFANGLKDTMMMILGEQENIYFVNFSPSESAEEFEKKLSVIFNSIEKEKDVIFLTDLFGGTPNNLATKIKLTDENRVEVICGVNLPLLMSTVMAKNATLKEQIDSLLNSARDGIVRIALQHDYVEDDE